MVIFMSNIERPLIEVAAAWSRCVKLIDGDSQLQILTELVGGWPLGVDMTVGNLACEVGDKSCKVAFHSGMDVKESFHSGNAASELFSGFVFLASLLRCDIADIVVVSFLSEPGGRSAFINLVRGSDRELTWPRYALREGHSRFGIC